MKPITATGSQTMTKTKTLTEEIELIDIGEPYIEDSRLVSKNRDTYLTWWWFRRLGFRIATTNNDCHPHMMLSVGKNYETALEIAPPVRDRQWFCWLRSDIAYSRCRFVFIRHLTTVGELADLIKGVGAELNAIDFDSAQFQLSLSLEARDAKRRWSETTSQTRMYREPG